ncbi:hypothetical protein DV737_g4128, partial [Chaetothyriales sp. CBS 132003]
MEDDCHDGHDDDDVDIYGQQTPATFPANFFANPFATSATQKRPPPPPEPATDEPAKTTDGQFHFIDMADRKGAMRIRNTRISRQYKENKVRRIAELESKLAAALARIDELERGSAEIK